MDCKVVQDAYDTTTQCLPHTGLDLWPIVAVGIVLLAVGGVILFYLMGLDDEPQKPEDWQGM